jgi:tRNA-splicing ligase RtcB (3'-phosphate/5'-hydroxy nucleic acid ligase)
MFTMRGKYNTANIMIDSVDATTQAQIQSFLNHPAFANTYIAIMPDCHAGKGAVVGFTMKMNDYVIPFVIGVDIGCGMLMAKFSVHDVDLPGLDSAIKETIPSGFHINDKIAWHVPGAYDVCHRIGIDADKAARGLGSLGGGNHFIEAGFDSEHRLTVTIHSGSRNFGLKVAEFYQNKAKALMKKMFIGADAYRDLEFLPMDARDAQDYLHDLNVAQEFASKSRHEMMDRVAFFLNADSECRIESVHNFIGADKIIRKGATPAREGEDVIIPFNMADGIALCKGKGSAKYNFSAPHGAGRIMSRAQAKKTLSSLGFADMMKDAGVYTTTANEGTIDEAPGAYKSMDLILENIQETVEVVELIKPVYNFKAGGE